jgi:hypothetical protein
MEMKMLFHRSFRPTVAVAIALAAAPLLAMQEPAKQDPAKQQEKPKPEAPAKPEARPASAARMAPVSIPVTGLTAENTEKLKTSLTALKQPVWICAACKEMSDAKGACPACKKELTAENHPVFASITPDAKAGTVNFSLNEGLRFHLSELDRALATGGAKVDTAKLTLPGTSMLMIQGPTSEEDAKKLEAALKSSKLFGNVEIDHKPESRDYRVLVTASDKAPTHADIAKAIEQVGNGFKLADVGWYAPKRLG